MVMILTIAFVRECNTEMAVTAAIFTAVSSCTSEDLRSQQSLSSVKGSSQMFYNLYLHFIDPTMSPYMLLDVISTSDKIRMKMVYIQGDKSYNAQ